MFEVRCLKIGTHEMVKETEGYRKRSHSLSYIIRYLSHARIPQPIQSAQDERNLFSMAMYMYTECIIVASQLGYQSCGEEKGKSSDFDGSVASEFISPPEATLYYSQYVRSSSKRDLLA